MKTAEEWIKSWDVAPDFPKENLDKHVAILREIQADAFKAGELKGRKDGLEEAAKICKKHKNISASDLFAEAIRQHAASLGGGE